MWCQQPFFFDQARKMTEETISMKLTWHRHSAFRIEAGADKVLIDPFLYDNPVGARRIWAAGADVEDPIFPLPQYAPPANAEALTRRG